MLRGADNRKAGQGRWLSPPRRSAALVGQRADGPRRAKSPLRPVAQPQRASPFDTRRWPLARPLDLIDERVEHFSVEPVARKGGKGADRKVADEPDEFLVPDDAHRIACPIGSQCCSQ